MACFLCNSGQDVQLRVYSWHYRPRPKYKEPDQWTTLEINLCSSCDPGPTTVLIGRDWWDAVDGLG
uniref:Uncharacterized protein n=1 Tax=viral metagenome TaxID=1070528 RepID=A0A6C0BPF3_9ZZZZ